MQQMPALCYSKPSILHFTVSLAKLMWTIIYFHASMKTVMETEKLHEHKQRVMNSQVQRLGEKAKREFRDQSKSGFI